VLLIGGAAANQGVCTVAASLFGLPVVVPAPGEYVADGAARQAAWALAGSPEPPAWTDAASSRLVEADPVPAVREAYAAAREALYA
jgi:xylulokinase